MINKINKKRKYKVITVVLCVMLSSGFVSLQSFFVTANNTPEIKVHMDNTEGLETPPDITAASAILLNADTGEVLYEKNSRQIIYPASTVKIMTAIVVIESLENLESEVVISRYVVNNMTGNIMEPKISEGEAFTVEALLNAMLLRGMNDAALALAEYVSGNVTDFVSKMNEKAVELGCENTVFTNPTGMHSDLMRTTAFDMAKIAFHASKIQKIMDITSSPKYIIESTNKEKSERSLVNRNHFVSKGQYSQYYYEYARGINYGSTAEAGHCLTTVAGQTGLSYLGIVMGATSVPIAGTDNIILNCFNDAKSLFEWAFSLYSYKKVVSLSDKFDTVEIKLSANRDTVTLVPDAEIIALFPQNVDINGEEITRIVDIFEDELVAPIEKNQQLGVLTVLYNGEIIGTANLLSSAAVEISNILYILEQIKGVVSGIWFKASVIIFAVIFVFYVVISLWRKSKKERKRFY